MNKQQEAAQYLYCYSGLSQKDIAAALFVSEQTISAWKQKYGWEQVKMQKELTLKNTRERVAILLDYQTSAQVAQTEQHRENAKAFNKPMPLLNEKVFLSIERALRILQPKNNPLSDYIKMSRELLDFAQGQDLELCKKFIPIVDEFIKQKKGDD